MKGHFNARRCCYLLVFGFIFPVTSERGRASSFEPPHWAGQPGTDYSEWQNFTSAVGEPGNAPDADGSTGEAVLRQLAPGAIITGTGNVYNPAGPSLFTVTDQGIARLGIFILGFETDNAFEPGRGDSAYEILSARVTLMTTVGFEVAYDPTFDPVFSYLTDDHPDYVADVDVGRPLELCGAGFRNGITASSWTESDPYASENGERTVYPVILDEVGNEVDASMNVNYASAYEVIPFAIGTIAGVNAGDSIPEQSLVSFDLDLTRPGVVRYLQRGLNSGLVTFTATSLHSGGQGVRTFPEYYTRDSLIGEAPGIDLSVRLHEAQETVTVRSILAQPAGRRVRFAANPGAAYGIRWSDDLKNWHLVRDPELTAPEEGVLEWLDDSAVASARFYQIYLKP
jgi:hypothetical protein